MSSSVLVSSSPARLSPAEFDHLVKLVYEQCGINLTPAKKVMLESRLTKRLRSLSLTGFKEYIDFLKTKGGIEQELIHMIDVVTTNKTDFFREPHHFDFMKSTVLPEFQSKHNGSRPFKIWSSACSTGEEPYTMAMVLQEFANQHPSFTYNILASDISTQVLQRASTAVYSENHVAPLPLSMKQKYLLRSKDQEKPTVRIIPKLRERVSFLRVNLMDSSWKIEDQDVIFCRNVLIYFDRKTQIDVVTKLVNKLRPGGLLVIGHSESLHSFDLPLTQIKPTIFIKE